MLLSAGAVLVGYGVAVTVLGLAAYRQQISLQTLVTMVTMLPTTMAVGSISYGDIDLEKLLLSVPDLEALTTGLGRRAAPV